MAILSHAPPLAHDDVPVTSNHTIAAPQFSAPPCDEIDRQQRLKQPNATGIIGICWLTRFGGISTVVICDALRRASRQRKSGHEDCG